MHGARTTTPNEKVHDAGAVAENENVNTSEEGERRDEDLEIKFLFKSTDLIKTFKIDAYCNEESEKTPLYTAGNETEERKDSVLCSI